MNCMIGSYSKGINYTFQTIDCSWRSSKSAIMRTHGARQDSSSSCGIVLLVKHEEGGGKVCTMLQSVPRIEKSGH